MTLTGDINAVLNHMLYYTLITMKLSTRTEAAVADYTDDGTFQLDLPSALLT